MDLAEQECEPCATGGIPLSAREAEELFREVPKWSLKEKSIERELRFKDFRQAMDCVNKIAAVAEEEGQHPDIFISYNRVRLFLSTHKIGGLSRNDFILASKIGRLPDQPA